ncbi:MAG TPA: cobalt ECF transporter T component CbiQ [Thermoguttaceae bacterium]|nr:cobalt ECF transporter T component CbiQ [Thermoguttaceae bacterium]
MTLDHHPAASYLARIDPRARVVAVVLLAIAIAAADRFAVPATALAAGLLGTLCSGVSMPTAVRRLLPLNVLMLLMALVLPLTTPGQPVLEIGWLSFSREGFELAALIAVKGNAIVLLLLVLLDSLDATTLGHTLSHLRVPDKLTHLLLFTVRYLDVLHREYLRMRAAMKVRAFRPRMNRHTYRTYGHLVGMLLVRSFERSERIVAAMKCRGFHGRFYLFEHFHFSRRDVPFCAVSLLLLLTLVLMEWA